MQASDEQLDKILEKLEARLTGWGAKIDELATQAGSKARAAVRHSHEELNKKREVARAKLDELKSAGGDRWASVKRHLDAAFEELEAAIMASGPPKGRQ